MSFIFFFRQMTYIFLLIVKYFEKYTNILWHCNKEYIHKHTHKKELLKKTLTYLIILELNNIVYISKGNLIT